MKQVNIHDAKTNFSKLINMVLEGEEIVIAKSGKPIVRLIGYSEELTPRKGGQLRGMIKISEDFDDELPKEYINDFYDGEI